MAEDKSDIATFHFAQWLAVLCMIVVLAPIPSANAADAAPAKRVLIIATGSRLSPGFTLMDRAILEVLGNNPSERIHIHAENLDILRFPPDRFQRIFREYLTEKYAQQHPDLIILVFVGNLGIAGKLLYQLFPGTPVIVAGGTEEELPADQFLGPVGGVASRANPRATLELIFRLQPETQRVVVIAGGADVDRQVLDRVKEAASSFAGRVKFEFWDNRNMAELRELVSALPPQTAILVSRIFRDGDGQAVISSQAGQSIAQWANVPVYVMTELALGTGAVGGSVASVEAIGKRAGELARLILNGTDPVSLPLERDTGRVSMFDWRALKRWGISESRLPPNSIVRFRPASLWEEYRWYIIGALITIGVQAAMIAALLAQRARRRRVEAELRESHDRIQDLAGRLITAQEAERSRIARDLHDDVNQELAGLSIALSNVKRRLQNEGDASVRDEISRLQQRTADVADMIRHLSHDLHPGVLQHAGLVAALKGHCAEFGSEHAIEVTVSAAEGLDGIPQDVALCLYRVAQEALHNIAAHAHALKAQVSLRSSEECLELVIADDGQGFDLTEARGVGGLGLMSLDERVRLVGGSLTIHTQPKRGTKVRVQVPLRGTQ